MDVIFKYIELVKEIQETVQRSNLNIEISNMIKMVNLENIDIILNVYKMKKMAEYEKNLAELFTELPNVDEKQETLEYHKSTSHVRLATEKTGEFKPTKSKVLIVACHHGKNLGASLSLLSDKISVESIVKPDATDTELIKTAFNYSETFTDRDFLILWPSTLHPLLVDIFIRGMKNTNPIILTQPYQYNQYFNNNYVFNNNTSIHIELISRRIRKVNLIDCNRVLRKCNYHKNGQIIKIRGKRFIAKLVFEYINGYMSVW
ncbi:uncharacterized protein [Leptinotarsa decemlineata]|uniref:uncharacterized protein n=1 Tax=Leptinotarsa decemlineata TaxID=7539 RepID=UPI003D30979D